jgi:hypothetical protein
MATQSLLNSVAINYLYCANIKDMPKIIDLQGKTFGDYQVVSYHSQDKFHNALWICFCTKCKAQKILKGSRLAKGLNTTCYCGVHYNKTHGDSRKTKEYRAYRHMLNRCYNSKVRSYKNYGGRGISVCDRWLNSYENFLADMGRAPSPKHSLDRLRVNENYGPGNCKWSTDIEQANNTTKTYKVNYNGNVIALGLFCREHNVPIELIRGRLNNGWSVERAISTPKKTKNETNP